MHACAVIVVWVCVFFCGVSGVHHLSGASLCGGPVGVVVWVGVGLVVCVTSCEGHMVDALASRADEGRRSLR